MRRHVALAAVMGAVWAVASACGVLRPDAGAPDYDSVRERLSLSANERRAEAATVRVRNLGCDALSTGSGFVVGERELVTNAHVVAGAEKLEITTWDGHTLNASVEGATVSADLARVRVDADLPPPATLAPADPVPGDALVVYGYPGGGALDAEAGSLISYADVDGQRSFLMTNEVRPGNSGGPVFGASGEVVGVVRALLVDADQGVAIPVSVLSATNGSALTEGIPGCEGAGGASGRLQDQDGAPS